MSGIISEIWRYPVKSFGGEKIDSACAVTFGLEHDRRYAFIDTIEGRVGKPLTARNVDELLIFKSGVKDGGVYVRLLDGSEHRIDEPQVQAAVEKIAGRPLKLRDAFGANHDGSHVTLIGNQTLRQVERSFGAPVDQRRFRANLWVDGLEPGEEDTWVGLQIRVGDVVLHGERLCDRCVMVTYDPETLEPKPQLLRTLNHERATNLGVRCRVVQGGLVSTGDLVQPIIP